MDISKKSTDKELIRSYIEGNHVAFEFLLARHKDRIFGYLMSIVKNKKLAEDLFQDAFFKIVTTLNKGRYNEEGKFLPWAMRISHNLAIDYFRKGKKMQMVSQNPKKGEDDDFDIFSILKIEESSVEDDMIQEQIRKDVRALIERLPKEQREIIWMRHFKEMNYKDIAEAKNISINTALGRMRYALINLRKIIEDKKVSLTEF